MPLSDLKTLINATPQNLSQFKGLSTAYGVLLGGAPSIDGYTALINANNSSNFGAGGTTKFNDENIYINTVNALYQGNPAAKSAFDAIVSSAATIQDALTLVYNYVIPASARTQAGLDYFKSQASFYASRAAELGVAGTNGTALVAFASLTKIAVDNDIGGLGDTINDLKAAVDNNTAQIPQSGTTFTPLETADGTQFDADDVGGGANQGKSFTLTIGEDSGTPFTGTAANDTYTAGVVQDNNGNLKNSLTSIDSLNGGDGTDTLEATLNDAAVVAPVLSSIENVTVRLTNAAAGIDLTNATGVTNLRFNASTAAGGTNILGSATGLSITNQKTDVTADKSTATTLALTFDKAGTVSATAPEVVTLDLGKSTASKATTLNIATTNSNVKVDSTQADIATTVNVVATGSNTLNLVDVAGTATTVAITGAGSVDMTGTAFTKVATLTAADGGLKFNATGNTATALSVTTGGGDDTLTVTGANLTSLNSGGGKDTITVTTALAATSNLNAGAGDDTVTLNAAPTAGATIAGGDGNDTIALNKADFGTVSAFSATNLAKISGFEVLSITDALANGATYDASKITSAAGFTAAAGVTNNGAATVSNLAANATVTIAGVNTGAKEVDTIVKASASNAGANKWEAGDVVTVTINGVAVSYTVVAGDVAADDTALFTSIKAALDANAYVASKVAVVVTNNNTLTLTAKDAAAGENITVAASIVEKAGGTAGADTLTVTETTSAVATVGSLTTALKTDTSTDVLNLVLRNTYQENNDATASVSAISHKVDASNIETLNVQSTGKADTTFAAAAGTKADGVNNTLVLTDNQIVTLTVTGDQAFTFSTADAQTKLATIDASALAAGATLSAANTTTATNAAITIKGSTAFANTLTGSANADTIFGGTKNDTITGGGKGDTLTGGGGNDKFVFAAGDSVLGSGTFDTITDFIANTVGQGANGAVTVAGAIADSTKWTGDLLQIAKTGDGSGGIKVSVFSNAADASTFLANNKAANTVVAALDSSTGAVYIDNVGADGVADLYIKLAGVTTLDAAAFILA